MKILTFDTCLDKMYVALGDDEGVLSSRIIETTETTYHSAFLISTITNVLEENKITPKEIDVISTNVGPGSFTGIRACTTVARVMAQGIGEHIKTIGISSLEILSRINNTEKQTLVALDARKEMAYVAVYDKNQEIMPPKAMLLEDLKQMISDGNYFIVTDNSLETKIGGISYQKGTYDLGEVLINITKEKLADCETNWRKLLPLYIQPPALTIKKEK